jgi:UDP-N-acetylmuramoyl-tripeptide--D-alanyl-D-alanine ligase
MKTLLHFILKKLAKKIMRRFRPFVIGITGSVGKTSAKDAIYTILRKHFQVRKNEKNYNNEIGVPLTIIGAESGGHSVFKWFKVFVKALKLIYSRSVDFSDMLILEMGADKKGDIEYLLSFAPCDIGVLTAVSPAHLEQFGVLDNVYLEKSQIINKLTNAHVAVINGDDPKIKDLKNQIKAKVYTCGFLPDNDLQATDVRVTNRDKTIGTSFKIKFKGNIIPVFLPNIFGRPQIFSCLMAVAVADAMNVEFLEAIDDLSAYQAPKGRTNLISGIKETLIIDDSYNSSPESVKAAIELLKEMPSSEKGRKIAVLGEMLELGNYTETGHAEVGKKTAEVGVDLLVTVGERTRDIIRGAIKAGLSEEKTIYFDNNHDAGIFVQNKIHPGDIILIKGSQGARMEQIVKEIMAEPDKARELLCRQDGNWLER